MYRDVTKVLHNSEVSLYVQHTVSNEDTISRSAIAGGVTVATLFLVTGVISVILLSVLLHIMRIKRKRSQNSIAR